MIYTERKTVEEPIIDTLEKLGWEYVQASEFARVPEEPFDLPTLQAAISRLNPGIITTDEEVERVVSRLRMLSNDISGNREFFEWLKGERSLVLKTGEKAKTIRLVDFDDIETNRFVVTNQFRFIGYEEVRFDIVLLVNGLPLVIMEAKAPTMERVDYREAINQLKRYHSQAPQIFKYLAFVCATDGLIFKYDWVDENYFFEWKDPLIETTAGYDPVKVAVDGLFERKAFLDIAENFIVFEKEREEVRKKIARYQQVKAANEIVERVSEGKTRIGLVWHFQGSGKTLTMLWAAWKLKKLPQLRNPTILVVVDRLDLESQLLGTFRLLPYTDRADSARSLIEKLKRDSREVIITTIQKFERIEEVLSKRENIIIFIDEAHRTQYGRLAAYMRKAIPNAFIFGFTGTPIDKGPLGKSTFRVFCPRGERYLDKYSIRQSTGDGATVPIYYLPRLPEYRIDKETLDREFLEKTRGLSEDAQQKVLQRSVTLRNTLKAPDRINRIAKDIADHFRAFIEPRGFKAQLVAVDREGCALYKEALDTYLPPEYSVVIYTPNPNDDERLRRYHLPKVRQLEIAGKSGKFQKPGENPKILIVTDMLLTGFDAPVEQVMYLDKPLRDHNLLQAIARTNRPYQDKVGGIIADYVGIFDNLVKALNFEEEEVEGIALNFDELKKDFSKTVSELLGMFARVKRDEARQSLFEALKVLEDEDMVREFKEGFAKLKSLFETISPDPFILDYIETYQWLTEVNIAYNRFSNRQEETLTEYGAKTKQLIQKNLLVEKIRSDMPILRIDSSYLEMLDSSGYRDEEKVMEIKQALTYHIRVNLETNPVYETLSQRLERILKIMDRPRLLSELKSIAREIARVESKATRLGLTREQFALLSVVKKYLPQRDETELKSFAVELAGSIKPKVFSGWHNKRSVVLEVEEGVLDTCREKFSDSLSLDAILSMSEELMRFVKKHNP